MESSWPQEIVQTLGKVEQGGLEDSTKSSLEDFLCSVVKHQDGALDELKKNDVIKVCQKHMLKDLATVISAAGLKKKTAATAPAAAAPTEKDAREETKS